MAESVRFFTDIGNTMPQSVPWRCSHASGIQDAMLSVPEQRPSFAVLTTGALIIFYTDK